MSLKVEVTLPGGLGQRPVVQLDCTQLVLRLANGDAILIAEECGPDGNCRVVQAGDPGFASAARNLGISPPDCRLLAAPGLPSRSRR